MRLRFQLLPIFLAGLVLLPACAGSAPKRPGAGAGPGATLAEQRADFLSDCRRRERLNQPRSVECPDSPAEPRLSQPSFGPLTPFPSLPTLPGGLIR